MKKKYTSERTGELIASNDIQMGPDWMTAVKRLDFIFDFYLEKAISMWKVIDFFGIAKL